jgi:hypothetical protein
LARAKFPETCWKTTKTKMESTKIKVSVVIGSPGSGKGAQCDIYAKKHNFLHVSTGGKTFRSSLICIIIYFSDMCRELVELRTPAGLKIEPYLKNNNVGNFMSYTFIYLISLFQMHLSWML